jgi:hypothetical protein
MGRRIAPELAFVAGRGDDLALLDDDGADRHVVVGRCALGLGER